MEYWVGLRRIAILLAVMVFLDIWTGTGMLGGIIIYGAPVVLVTLVVVGLVGR